MAKFSINEVVVYSGQGVGVVHEIIKKTIGGETLDYYVIYLSDSDMTVLVPIDRSKELGVRSIISKKEAKEAIEFLKEVNEPIIMDWKARYQKNMQLFKSGDIKNTAIVVKSLYRRSKVKELPIQERKLYEAAYNVFQDEIVAVLGLAKKEVEEMIHNAIEPMDGEEIVETIRKKELKEDYEEYEEDEENEMDED
ncbi:MAG: CarD family transcriptional regulator [Treponema sp.]